MLHFLLIYDVEKGQLRETPRVFEKANLAMDAYATAEAANRGSRGVQVVLVASDSLETVMVTHRNFFKRDTIDALITDLLGYEFQIH